MRLKPRKSATMEVSERRQVGDAETMVNENLGNAWWRKVGMEEI